MSITHDTQAILLLTAHFSKPKADAVKPLAPKEWGRFAAWLKENRLTPEKIMTGQLDELLLTWEDKTVTLPRIEELMMRGSALALAMDKWLRAGLWVMTRSDPEYPRRVKQRLGTDSPAVLFGCGNRRLLNGGGLAVVGSRHTTASDLAFSRDIGKLAASNGFSIVSGGARGVDEAAMLGALSSDGTVIGVLADKLLQHCSSAKYRNHLMRNELVLISPFYPEAGFNVGNAMQRNKYIYCLADAGLVVHSGVKGGTWTGAKENLKKGWVPLWVKETEDKKAGNKAIVADGAAWISSELDSINFENLIKGPDYNGGLATNAYEGSFDNPQQFISEAEPELPHEEKLPHPTKQIDSYDIFLMKIEHICEDTPRTVEELAEIMSLNTTQLKLWLNQAHNENKIQKLFKPARYQWIKEQGEDETHRQGTLEL